MTKGEFLEKLKEALENDLSSYEVQENLEYYRSYINEETARGRGEEAVLEELGDPWVIAQSVIDMAEHRRGDGERTGAGESAENYWNEMAGRRQYSGTQIHTFRADAWWKKLLLVLGIIGIVLIVFAVIGGLLSLILPVAVPILLVVWLFRIFGQRR